MGYFKRIINKMRNIYFMHCTPEQRAEYMRDKVYYMGKNVKIYTTSLGTEPYLLSIHDNVNIASGVSFITHDVSCWNLQRYLGLENGLDKCGKIELWDNCMVGSQSILMMGSSIGKNSVLAAGSVLTKKIPDNEVWGGNPARFIMTTEEYARKVLKYNEDYTWIKDGKSIAKSQQELIQMRQKFFFDK